MIYSLTCLLIGIANAFGVYQIIQHKSKFWTILLCCHVAIFSANYEYKKEDSLLKSFVKGSTNE